MATRHKQKLETFMHMAINLGSLSTCSRRDVGCIFIDGNYKIVGSGYNGVAHGATHCKAVKCAGANSLSTTNLGECGAIHAEQNALMQCSDVSKIRVAIVTTFPCMHCVKMLLNTGCSMIVYKEDYDEAAKKYWLSRHKIVMKV
jgi:dCMP deaminase